MRMWRSENHERGREISRRANRKRLSTPEGKLAANLLSSMHQSLSKGSKNRRHWEDLVGYTVARLKRHLEKQFKPGMTWENKGKWEIDHKIPVVAFNYERPEDIDFKRCWSLENLQPLWAEENRKKHTNIGRPFQPSLMI